MESGSPIFGQAQVFAFRISCGHNMNIKNCNAFERFLCIKISQYSQQKVALIFNASRYIHKYHILHANITEKPYTQHGCSYCIE